MNLIRNFVLSTYPGLKKIWFFLLPWLGYLAALRTAPDSAPLLSTILIGWALLFVYQPLKLGLLDAEPLDWLRNQKGKTSSLKASLLAGTTSLLPAALIGVNQFLMDGSWKGYFLEQFTLEVFTLVGATVGVLLFGRNHEGRTAWQDLGGIPVFFGAIMLGGVWGIVTTWWRTQHYSIAPAHTLVILTFAIGSGLLQDYRTLGRVARKEIVISDILSGKWEMVIIFGQLVLWVALPAVRLL